MLGSQQQPVGQQAGMAVQRPLRCDAGQLRKIIALRQMCKNHVCCLAVVLIFKEGCRCLVGEVAHPREHSLLYRPRIGPVAQHLQVMIRLQQQQVHTFELSLYVGRNIAQVGGKGYPHAFRLENKTHRVSGVVGNGEGADGNIADLERLPGLEVLDGR